MNEIYLVVRGNYDGTENLRGFADYDEALHYAMEFNSENAWSDPEERARVEPLPFHG